MNNKEMKKMMQDAGVPDQAISTTLVKESQQSLRDFIQSTLFITPEGRRGIYVFPQRPVHAPKARKVFQVAAKEWLLSGESVYCLSLTRLIGALQEEGDELELMRAEGAVNLFLLDFYERGAMSPMQGWQAGVVRSWIKYKFERGGAVSLLGDTPLTGAGAWWPESFLGYLSAFTVSFPVE